MARPTIKLHDKAKAQGFSARFLPFMGKQLADGRRPITLQVTHNGVSRRYSIGEACLPEQWDTDAGRMKPRVKGAAQVNSLLNVIEAKVKESVDALVVHVSLSLEAFDKRYRNPKATADLLAYMEDMEVKLKAEGRTGYAIMFRNAVSALRRFNEDRPIRFHELTARQLEAFEGALKTDGCTAGGIATYMRVIRVAMNQAIKDGLLTAEQYPFETARHKGYSMKRLKATTRPKALSEADLAKIKAFPYSEQPRLASTVRLFLFSYYARGINFADIARLDLGSQVEERIQYTRTKTKRKGEGANFSIPVSPPMEAILTHFRDRNSRYLFPILKGTEKTEEAIWSRIKDQLQHVNRDLKKVARVLGIPSLTFYVARHTYATTLKRRGVDVSVISESMGHDNVSTTTAYLKRFENEVLDAADQLL